jgi:uncharacterized membrane protein YphA (DoxX/SURF4 family)
LLGTTNADESGGHRLIEGREAWREQVSNPVSDLWAFLTADTGDFNALGWWKYLILLVFYLLMIASIVLLIVNWREDREQRTGLNLWLYVTRVAIGCMWFQGTLWKLPFGRHNGLYYWTEQMAGRAAFQIHREFVTNVILPNFVLVNLLVYFAELGFATALILGLFVRLAGVAAALFTINLWLGIYNQRPGDPSEWPWSYMFLIILCANFAVFAAGRAFGVDAWLRHHLQSVTSSPGLGALVRLIT